MGKQMPTIIQDNDKFYRFQVFQGDLDQFGKVKKTNSVGMAYLKDGQNIFTLRLWMFVNEKFYLIVNQNDTAKYLVMTREPNKNPLAKNKYYWNIVGHGLTDSKQGLIAIHFDLLTKPIFMSIHPEFSAYSVHLPEPEKISDAA